MEPTTKRPRRSSEKHQRRQSPISSPINFEKAFSNDVALLGSDRFYARAVRHDDDVHDEDYLNYSMAAAPRRKNFYSNCTERSNKPNMEKNHQRPDIDEIDFTQTSQTFSIFNNDAAILRSDRFDESSILMMMMNMRTPSMANKRRSYNDKSSNVEDYCPDSSAASADVERRRYIDTSNEEEEHNTIFASASTTAPNTSSTSSTTTDQALRTVQIKRKRRSISDGKQNENDDRKRSRSAVPKFLQKELARQEKDAYNTDDYSSCTSTSIISSEAEQSKGKPKQKATEAVSVHNKLCQAIDICAKNNAMMLEVHHKLFQQAAESLRPHVQELNDKASEYHRLKRKKSRVAHALKKERMQALKVSLELSEMQQKKKTAKNELGRLEQKVEQIRKSNDLLNLLKQCVEEERKRDLNK